MERKKLKLTLPSGQLFECPAPIVSAKVRAALSDLEKRQYDRVAAAIKEMSEGKSPVGVPLSELSKRTEEPASLIATVESKLRYLFLIDLAMWLKAAIDPNSAHGFAECDSWQLDLEELEEIAAFFRV